MRDKYLTVAEFAAHFKITQRTVRYMLSSGELAAVRVSARAIRIPLTEVERISRQSYAESAAEETSPARTTGMSLNAAKALRAAELRGDAA